MQDVTYDRSKLQKLGRRRKAALDELEAVRKAVAEEVPHARDGGLTWREIGMDSYYTENQLQKIIPKEG